MQRHQVLLAGVNNDLARRLVLQLTSFGVEFVRVPWAGPVAAVAARNEFNAVVIVYPDYPPTIDAILEEIRSSDSISRYAGIVLLGRGRQLKRARWYVGRGVNRAVSLEDPDEVWRDAVLDLLDVARRFQLRAPVEVTAELGAGSLNTSCRTENVSLSGMLLCCPREIPVGSTLRFALSVPGEDDPIRGEALVARSTNPQREGIDGIGASFLTFLEADQSRLRSVLARQTS
jgi:hypothetical protein